VAMACEAMLPNSHCKRPGRRGAIRKLACFLARHRAEMLQNFEDLENASSSKAALWLFD
jgi:hypothetical protein